jgi:putative exporter of polyketide antibiotics
VVTKLFGAWDHAVRSSSAVENWHSVLRPFLAVHRHLSADMLAILAVWHNHQLASRGLHKGLSPLMRSGLANAPTDWLAALGYSSASLSCELQPCSMLSLEHKMEGIAA